MKLIVVKDLCRLKKGAANINNPINAEVKAAYTAIAR
jgi:hypothetical protein